MEALYRVKDVAAAMGCSYDTARARMREMPGVMNVGTQRRRQRLVPDSGIMDWLKSHSMAIVQDNWLPVQANRRTVKISLDGRMARRDRRTGELVTKKKSR